MELEKRNLPIPFALGVDTKTDKWQVQPGKFLVLLNSLFTTGKRLSKRNGYGLLASMSAGKGAATFQNELVTFDGSYLYSYAVSQKSLVNKGALTSIGVTVSSIVRNTYQQTSQDSCYHTAGVSLYVWEDSSGGCRYSVIDQSTGQSIVSNQLVLSTASQPHAFALGSNLAITYVDTATGFLRLASVPATSPASALTFQTIASDVNASAAVYDALAMNGGVTIAYNTNAGGSGSIGVRQISSTLIVSAKFEVAGQNGSTAISIVADSSNNAWVAAYDGTTLRYFVVSSSLVLTLGFTTLENLGNIRNVTGYVSGTTATFLYEQAELIPTAGTSNNRIRSITGTSTGTVSAATSWLRSVGLAGKTFSANGHFYTLTAYGGATQPGYFLVDETASVVARFAYQNGGGYTAKTSLLTQVAQVSSAQFQLAYLYRDLLQTISGKVYTQTGVNSIVFDFSSKEAYLSTTLGNNLLISGACPQIYDGTQVVEQGFNVYPDSLTVQGGGLGSSVTGNTTSGSTIVTGLSSVQGLQVNQIITCANFPSPTWITVISPTGYPTNTIVVNQTATATGTGVTITFFGAMGIGASTAATNQVQYCAIYDWTDAQGNRHKSAAVPVTTSIPFTKLTIAFTGTGNSGDTQITVAAGLNARLCAGQVLTGTGIASGTKITGFSTIGPAILIDTPLTGTLAGTNNISTADFQNGQILIPTLRVTKKTSTPVSITLYRTANNQTTFYRVSSPTWLTYNSTTADFVTIIDTLSDALLTGNELLYTTGGTVSNIPAPALASLAVYQSRVVAVNAEDKTSLWYSKQVVPGSPVEFNDTFIKRFDTRGGTALRGVGTHLDDKCVAFKDTLPFYFTGVGPDATGANNDFSDPIAIAADTGCTDPASVLTTKDGLMFRGSKGLCLLNRALTVDYVGWPVEGYVTSSTTVTSATLFGDQNQIRFTLSSGVGVLYDYFYGQWSIFQNVSAAASVVFQGLQTYVKSNGQVYQETPGSYVDGNTPVTIGFTTCWYALAGLQGYQRAYFFQLLGQWISPHKLSVSIAYDYKSSPEQAEVLVPDQVPATYGRDPAWGESRVYGGNDNREKWRVFFNIQKCEAFQITLQEIFDPSYGTQPGAGLTLSGLNLVYGVKKGYRASSAQQSKG